MCTDELSDWRKTQRSEQDETPEEALLALIAMGFIEPFRVEGESDVRIRITEAGMQHYAAESGAPLELVQHG